MNLIRVALIAVVAFGCGPARLPGAPEIGGTCAARDLPLCVTAADVAFCESGKWVSYSCPGGCQPGRSSPCDWAGAVVGKRCPLVFSAVPGDSGGVVCGPPDAGVVIMCTSGTFTSQACSNCRVGSPGFACD